MARHDALKRPRADDVEPSPHLGRVPVQDEFLENRRDEHLGPIERIERRLGGSVVPLERVDVGPAKGALHRTRLGLFKTLWRLDHGQSLGHEEETKERKALPAALQRFSVRLDVLPNVVARVEKAGPRVPGDDVWRRLRDRDQRVNDEERFGSLVEERSLAKAAVARRQDGPERGVRQVVGPRRGAVGDGLRAAQAQKRQVGKVNGERVLARRIPDFCLRRLRTERSNERLVLNAQRRQHNVLDRPVLGLEQAQLANALGGRRHGTVAQQPARGKLDDRHAYGYVHVERALKLVERPDLARDHLFHNRLPVAVRRQRQHGPQRPGLIRARRRRRERRNSSHRGGPRPSPRRRDERACQRRQHRESRDHPRLGLSRLPS
mmetsp:Transcript_12508/g.41741  ORF Transcript_12508/g.41741 Transcript_12508/m.41741 type:complete len:378 (+) Transcript_12508:233-1366(+)